MEFSSESTGVSSAYYGPLYGPSVPPWLNAAGILMSLKYSWSARQVALGVCLRPRCSFDTLGPKAPDHYLPVPTDYYPIRYNFRSLTANQNSFSHPFLPLDVPTDVEVQDEVKSEGKDGKEKSSKCHVCDRVYTRPSTLRTHMRTHTGEKPYRCTICHKSFSQDANLTAHLRIHSGEKPFQCRICKRRFAQSSSVTTHMRTHSGERPYRCRVCCRGFADSSTLTKHLRVHTGEKPYRCTVCAAKFSQSGNLSRHMHAHKK